MSFSKKLKKLAMIGALGGSLLMPEAQAQVLDHNSEGTPRRIQVSRDGWSWSTDSSALRDRLAYNSLPAFYKAFANKSFMERFEMKETWEQKDFIKRDRKRSAILKKNPNATIKDFEVETSVSNLKLADYPCAEGSLWLKIVQEQTTGKLSCHQAKVAEELCRLGRPLATIDPNLSYAEQLESCGFDIAANVARGTKLSSLSARDLSIYIAQDQDAELINARNEEARRELRIRFEKEKDEEWEKENGFFSSLFRTKTRLLTEEETKGLFKFEEINGKSVAVPHPNEISYSIHDEMTRKVADKIEQEEKMANERTKTSKLSR